MTRGRRPGNIIETLVEPLVVGGLTLTRQGILVLERRLMKLTPRQADLLAYLMWFPGRPQKPAWLMLAVWGDARKPHGGVIAATVWGVNRRAGRKIVHSRWGWGYYVPA